MSTEKFWKGLKTSTRNSLLRHYDKLGPVPLPLRVLETPPWDMSVKQLIRIPGIGPSAIAEIARLTMKHCV